MLDDFSQFHGLEFLNDFPIGKNKLDFELYELEFSRFGLQLLFAIADDSRD